MRLLLPLYLIPAVLICHGCDSDTKSVNDFLQDPENGYTTTYIGNNVLLDITQLPARLVAVENLGQEKLADSEEFEEAVKEYEDFLHFKMELAPRTDNEVLSRKTLHQSDYQERVINLAYNFENVVYLITDSDTLPCTYAHLVREFGLNSRTRINFGFRKPETTPSIDSFRIVGDLYFLNESPFLVAMQTTPKQLPDNLLAP